MSALLNFIAIVAVILLLGGIARWAAYRRWRNQVDGSETDAEFEGRKTD